MAHLQSLDAHESFSSRSKVTTTARFGPPNVEPRIDTLRLRGSRFPRYTGKGCAPRGEPIFYYPLEPEGQRDACFVAVGTAEFAVAAEPLRLTAAKGFKYRLIGETVNAPRLEFFAVS